MALTLTIAGIDRTYLLRDRSLQVPDQIQSRGTCRFVLDDQPIAGGTGYHPSEGQIVEVVYNGVVLFAGTLDRVKWWVEPGTEPPLTISECAAVDYNQIADRHLVARAYQNMTAGAIVRDIVERDLAGEGILTTGVALQVSGSEVGAVAFVGTAQVGAIEYAGVEDGPVIDQAVFTYMPASQCFTELAELVGFYWNIDHDHVLTFAPREQRRAPFDISEAAGVDANGNAVSNFRAMDVERTREQYRNRQYIRAGTDTTDIRTESFKGDGASKTFSVAFPVATAPTVTVNAVAKTVGIKGVDQMGTYDWYWNKGVHELVQDDAGVALTTADTLAVTYQGSFPIVIAASDQQGINDRKAVEGGTGVYEEVTDDTSLDSTELANDKANAMLRRYSEIPQNVSFETDQPGLKAGQLVHIYSPRHGVNGDYLIDSASTADVGVGSQFLRTTVTAVSGERMDTWVDFFRKMVDQGKRFVLRENERLALGRTNTDVLGLADVLTLQQDAAAGAVVGFAVVGFSEVADIGVTVTGSEVGIGEVGTAVVGAG